jgi:hypothetical protein
MKFLLLGRSHPKLLRLSAALDEHTDLVSKQCISVFKAAQQKGSTAADEDHSRLLLEAGRAADAIGTSVVKQVTDAYCEAAIYNLFLPWTCVDAAPDAPWSCSQFTDVLEKAAKYVSGKDDELAAVFPFHWGMHRQLTRRVLAEARQTLRARLSDMSTAHVRAQVQELKRMHAAAAR